MTRKRTSTAKYKTPEWAELGAAYEKFLANMGRAVSFPLGTLDIDRLGVVTAYHPAPGSPVEPAEVLGRSFFADVAPCDELLDFQTRYAEFLALAKPSLHIDVGADGGAVRFTFLRCMDSKAIVLCKKGGQA